MPNNWFTNHGQALATTGTIGSFLIALLINWNAISEHQSLLTWWPVIVVPLAIYIAFRVGRSSRPAPAQPASVLDSEPTTTSPATTPYVPPSMSLPKYSERFDLDDDSVFIATKTVKLGDYWEIGSDLGRLKIAPLALSDLGKNKTGVEIRFDTQGSMFYGGPETKETGTNRFVLGETRSGFQAEEHCAYQYSFSDRHVHCKLVRVDHINAVAKEVVLEVCTVALRKVPRELPTERGKRT